LSAIAHGSRTVPQERSNHGGEKSKTKRTPCAGDFQKTQAVFSDRVGVTGATGREASRNRNEKAGRSHLPLGFRGESGYWAGGSPQKEGGELRGRSRYASRGPLTAVQPTAITLRVDRSIRRAGGGPSTSKKDLLELVVRIGGDREATQGKKVFQKENGSPESRSRIGGW